MWIKKRHDTCLTGRASKRENVCKKRMYVRFTLISRLGLILSILRVEVGPTIEPVVVGIECSNVVDRSKPAVETLEVLCAKHSTATLGNDRYANAFGVS